MFWKRATGHGAVAGLLSARRAALHHALTLPTGASPASRAAAHVAAWLSERDAQNSDRDLGIQRVLCRDHRGEPDHAAPPRKDLVGLVYSLTPRLREADQGLYARPAVLGAGYSPRH